MASMIDMSLDEIIKKKKKENPRKTNPKLPATQPPKKNPNQIQNKKIGPAPAKKKILITDARNKITDARNKIISKKRTQITDAREKLAELAKKKDARLKLEKLRLERMSKIQGQLRPVFPNRANYIRAMQPKETQVFIDPSRQVMYQPVTGRNFNRRPIITKKYSDTRSIGNKRHAERSIPRPKPILRTVENDIEMLDDPMGEEYSTPKALLNRKASLQLKIIAHNNDINTSRSSHSYRSAISERESETSPPRPPSILKKRPMAALRSDQIAKKTEKSALEYRVIVSNLRNTVTGGDIEELFGDIGGMLESRLVRPGTAEVLYKTQEYAQKAVELYHNRQLDGQPMNCLLVTPRTPSATAALQRNSSKPALYSTNSNVEPDIAAIHKVLFSNL